MCAGLHLRDLGTERLTWDELAAFVEHAPATSALIRATDPDAWITGEVQMLREVEQALRVLAWQRTEDGQKKQPLHYPERIPITEAARNAAEEAAAPEYEALPIDEMADFLGWPKRATIQEAS